MSYTSRFEYDPNTSANNESIEMAISGDNHQQKLRKAKNDLLDDWDQFADSEAQSYKEWGKREEPFAWRGLILGFLVTLSGGVAVWMVWQGYLLVKYLAGW